ncbi:MAG: signal recognition particle receptor subunit alpha [archaeon]
MSLGEQLRKAIERLRNSSGLDRETVKEAVKDIQRALIGSDVSVDLVLKLSKEIEDAAFVDLPMGINRREHILKTTYDLLAELLGGSPQPPQKPKKILLIGLFGSGKSTTCGKLAKWYAKRGLKVGLIAADTFRAAAVEQLRQVAEKANVEFFGLTAEKNAAKVVREGLKKFEQFDLIICDSAGRSALDSVLVKEIKEINSVFSPDQRWLVLGADIGQAAKKQAKAFHESVQVNGVIITKLDGSAKGGGALAACRETNSPVYFVGLGEKLDDFQEFDATRYLSRIMGYGDLAALLEKAKEIQEESGLGIEGMLGGEFNLDIFYKQLVSARKLGPLSKVAEMMGLGSQVPKEMLEVGEEKLEGFAAMMDSMTKKEKQNPELLNKSRIARIAKGSGKTQEDVRELLKNYRTTAKMFSQFKNIDEKKLEKGGMQGLLKKFGGLGKKKKKIKFR